MKKERLGELINEGREIEFDFKNKKYSITYYPAETHNEDISFCEFYQEPIDFKNVDELYEGIYNGIKISEMIDSLNENEIDIF